MKKYCVKRLIFSTPAGRRHLHDNFGVLWKLSRNGFLYIYLWILWARARFYYGTWLALMIARRNQCSSLIGFGMDPSVLWTSDVPEYLHTWDPISCPSRNPHGQGKCKKAQLSLHLFSVSGHALPPQKWWPWRTTAPSRQSYKHLWSHWASSFEFTTLLVLHFILTLHTWMCMNLEITWTLCSAMVWMRQAREPLMWKPPERESENTN